MKQIKAKNALQKKNLGGFGTFKKKTFPSLRVLLSPSDKEEINSNLDLNCECSLERKYQTD